MPSIKIMNKSGEVVAVIIVPRGFNVLISEEEVISLSPVKQEIRLETPAEKIINLDKSERSTPEGRIATIIHQPVKEQEVTQTVEQKVEEERKVIEKEGIKEVRRIREEVEKELENLLGNIEDTVSTESKKVAEPTEELAEKKKTTPEENKNDKIVDMEKVLEEAFEKTEEKGMELYMKAEKKEKIKDTEEKAKTLLADILDYKYS